LKNPVEIKLNFRKNIIDFDKTIKNESKNKQLRRSLLRYFDTKISFNAIMRLHNPYTKTSIPANKKGRPKPSFFKYIIQQLFNDQFLNELSFVVVDFYKVNTFCKSGSVNIHGCV